MSHKSHLPKSGWKKNVETAAQERFHSLVSDNSGDLADIKRSQCSDEELEGKIWTL